MTITGEPRLIPFFVLHDYMSDDSLDACQLLFSGLLNTLESYQTMQLMCNRQRVNLSFFRIILNSLTLRHIEPPGIRHTYEPRTNCTTVLAYFSIGKTNHVKSLLGIISFHNLSPSGPVSSYFVGKSNFISFMGTSYSVRKYQIDKRKTER